MLQHDLLGDLRTVVVAPLVRVETFGRPAAVLNPEVTVLDTRFVLSTAELAGISRQALGEHVGSLVEHRGEILAALDPLFTGI